MKKGAKFIAVVMAIVLVAMCGALAACAGEEVIITSVKDMDVISSAYAQGDSLEKRAQDALISCIKAAYPDFEGTATAKITSAGVEITASGTATVDDMPGTVTASANIAAADFGAEKYENATLSGSTLSYTKGGDSVTEQVRGIAVTSQEGYVLVIKNDLFGIIADRAIIQSAAEDVGEDENEQGGASDESGEEEIKDVVISKIENADMTALISNNVADFEEYLQLVVEGKIDQTVDGFAGDIDTAISNGTITISASGAGTQEGENVNVNIDETTLIAGDFAGTLYANAKVENGILVDLQGNPVENVDLDGKIVVETQYGVYVIEITPEGLAEIGVVVEKQNEGETGGETGGSEIIITSWDDVETNATLSTQVAQVLQDKLLTYTVLKSMFGNTISENALEDGSIQVFKWGFNTDGNGNLVSVDLLGCRHGFPMANTRRFMTATFTFESPISVSDITDKNNLNSEKFIAKVEGASYTKGTQYSINADPSLSTEYEGYLNLIMPLLVDEGYIDENTKLSCVSFDNSRSGTTAELGSVYNFAITCIDLNLNKYYYFNATFARPSNTPLDETIENAIVSGKYEMSMPKNKAMISSDIEIVNQEAINAFTAYSVASSN